jgi:HK97 family phage portal protein
VESRTASGLLIETRAAYPRDTPNDNDPASVPPGTVGPHTTGDPHGLQVVPYNPEPVSWPPLRVQPWSGWPTEWQTPNWFGQVKDLTDTAWACLDLNSSIIASMPPYLVGASSSLPADWLNNPDPDVYTSWDEFAKQLFWDFQMGECFVVATAYYANGYPARFHVVPPWMMNVDWDGGGFRRYSIGQVDVTADTLHIRYQGTVDDAHGHGPLEAGAGRLIAAQALGRYATQLAASGGIPHAVLKHPANLNAAQAYDLQTAWIEARMSSMGLPAVLSGGIEFETLSLDPEKMALVDLARWNESRICILFGVPPFLMGLPSGGDTMTYSNVMALFDYHWRAGLKPKVDPVMQALSGWLLVRGTGVELNRDEYVRPGPLERAQTDQILFNILDPVSGERAKTVAEIRELERFGLSAPSSTLTQGVLQ